MLDKTSELEEEYFKQKELELLKKFEKEREQYELAEEKEHLRRFHYMKCPKCFGDLKEESYRDVSIDRCHRCKGVWLDAGELERLSNHEESSVAHFFRNLVKRS
jgi:hypothetical protein